MSNQMPRDRPAELVITHQQMEAFRALYQEYREGWPSCDQIDQGGLGQVEALATQTLSWAAEILRSEGPPQDELPRPE